MNKKLALALFVGMASGVVLAANWITLAKAGMKAGIWGGRKLRDFSKQIAEDLEDAAAEAAHETAEQERT